MGKSTLTPGGGGGKLEYTVKGTKGTVKVHIYADAALPSGSGIARYEGTIGGKSYGVLITEA